MTPLASAPSVKKKAICDSCCSSYCWRGQAPDYPCGFHRAWCGLRRIKRLCHSRCYCLDGCEAGKLVLLCHYLKDSDFRRSSCLIWPRCWQLHFYVDFGSQPLCSSVDCVEAVMHESRASEIGAGVSYCWLCCYSPWWFWRLSTELGWSFIYNQALKFKL